MMYRIQIGEVYDGCIPKTVWFVQMKKGTMFGNKWITSKDLTDEKWQKSC